MVGCSADPRGRGAGGPPPAGPLRRTAGRRSGAPAALGRHRGSPPPVAGARPRPGRGPGLPRGARDDPRPGRPPGRVGARPGAALDRGRPGLGHPRGRRPAQRRPAPTLRPRPGGFVDRDPGLGGGGRARGAHRPRRGGDRLEPRAAPRGGGPRAARPRGVRDRGRARLRLQHARRGRPLHDGDHLRHHLPRGVRPSRGLLRGGDPPDLGRLRTRSRVPGTSPRPLHPLGDRSLRGPRRPRRRHGGRLPLRPPSERAPLSPAAPGAPPGDGHGGARARRRHPALPGDRGERARVDRRALRPPVGRRARPRPPRAAARRDPSRGRVGDGGGRLHAHPLHRGDARPGLRGRRARASSRARCRARGLRGGGHGVPPRGDDARPPDRGSAWCSR